MESLLTERQSLVVPWDPISTPFSEDELLALVLDGPGENSVTDRPRVLPSWGHADDPLDRIQRYTFWDVLTEKLSRTLDASGLSGKAKVDYIENFLDYVSDAIESDEQPLTSVEGQLQTHTAGHIIARSLSNSLMSNEFRYNVDFEVAWTPSGQVNSLMSVLIAETHRLVHRVEWLLEGNQTASRDP
jgi:hypothetical protein